MWYIYKQENNIESALYIFLFTLWILNSLVCNSLFVLRYDQHVNKKTLRRKFHVVIYILLFFHIYLCLFSSVNLTAKNKRLLQNVQFKKWKCFTTRKNRWILFNQGFCFGLANTGNIRPTMNQSDCTISLFGPHL